MKKLLLFIISYIIIPYSVYSQDIRNTAYREPTPQQINQIVETQVIRNLLRSMTVAEDVGKVKLALETPCMQVHVYSNLTPWGTVQYFNYIDDSNCEEAVNEKNNTYSDSPQSH